MGREFLTSDLHLGHANIIRYCERPFSSEKEMTETIIRRWNERVKDEDIVHHVGDFCFKNSNESRGEGVRLKASHYDAQLKGKKIYYKGNHDRNNSMCTHLHATILDYGGSKYYITHRPEDIDYNFPINFVGHVHQNWKFKRIARPLAFDVYMINVGVDVWDFYPKTIDEILSKFQHWKKHLGGETS